MHLGKMNKLKDLSLDLDNNNIKNVDLESIVKLSSLENLSLDLQDN